MYRRASTVGSTAKRTARSEQDSCVDAVCVLWSRLVSMSKLYVWLSAKWRPEAEERAKHDSLLISSFPLLKSWNLAASAAEPV